MEEKLLKSLEALKHNLNGGNVINSSSNTKTLEKPLFHLKLLKQEMKLSKKDFVAHCKVVVDLVCTPEVWNYKNFSWYLRSIIELLLAYAADDDLDRRNTAIEGLARLVSILYESQSSNLLFEFYCEIKRNRSSRSLRLALDRFSELCHLIRPSKLVSYAENLFPLLGKIVSNRAGDELLQEALCLAGGRIYSILGRYAAEKDVIDLLNAFIGNLSSESTIVRRYSALSIACLCKHNRRSAQLCCYTLKSLLNLLNASKPDRTRGLYSGSFITFRALLPVVTELGDFANRTNETSNLIVKDIYYIYQHLLAIFLYCSETAVIVSALEALAEFFNLGLFSRVIDFIADLNNEDFVLNEYEEDRERSIFELVVTGEERFANSLSISGEEENSTDNNAMGDAVINFVDNRSFDGRTATDYSEETGGVDGGDDKDLSELASEINFGDISEARDKTEEDSLDSMSQASLAAVTMRSQFEHYFDNFDTGNEMTRSPTSATATVTVNVEHFNLGEMNSIEYAARLVALKFLLKADEADEHVLISDEIVRVSHKSIALACLAAIVKSSPTSLHLKLVKDYKPPKSSSSRAFTIANVLGYAHHPDPNLKAQLAMLVGNYLQRIVSVPSTYKNWAQNNGIEEAFPLVDLLDILKAMLVSGSPVLAKQVLLAMQSFISPLLSSNEFSSGVLLELIEICLTRKTDSYWLVKTELINLIGRLPFKTLKFLEQKHLETSKSTDQRFATLSRRLVDDVIFYLMFDNDHRVRQAVMANLESIVSGVTLNVLIESPVEATTFEAILNRFSALNSSKIFNEMFPKLADVQWPLAYNRHRRSMFSSGAEAAVIEDRLDSNLLYFVHRCLHELATQLHRKASLVGAISALSTLVKTFPPEEHPAGWLVEGVTEGRFGQATDVIGFLVTLLTENSLVLLDLPTQQALMNLISELMLASVVAQTKKLQSEPQKAGFLNSEMDFLVQMNGGQFFGQMQRFYCHLMKCLVAYAALVEHNPALFVTFIHNLYSKGHGSKGTSTTTSTKEVAIRDAKIIKRELANKGSKKMEAKALDPLYGSLFELLKTYFRNRKFATGLTATSFRQDAFLGTVLDSLARLLEVLPLVFVFSRLDDLLVYLNMIYYLDAAGTVKVVRHLLKCIFQVNYLALFVEVAKQHLIANPGAAFSASTSTVGVAKLDHEASLYNIVYTLPYLRFSYFCNAYKARASGVISVGTDESYYGTFLSWLRKLIEFKHVKIMNSSDVGGGRRLASEVRSKIRLFQPLVIKSMRHYRYSADEQFQCEAMDLFTQLVQFHINYTLLDSDNEFLKFTLKQIEFAETSPIPTSATKGIESRSCMFDKLIGHIFYFLVVLCHEGTVNEEIISIPGLIQFCDRLVAAGHGHLAIDGLAIIVDHLFFFLNKPEAVRNVPDLEAQREVVVAYCFKLLDTSNRQRTFDLLALIVNYYRRSNQTKLVNLSIRIGNILVTKLVSRAIKVASVKEFESLQNLIFILVPTTFMGTIDLMECLLERKTTEHGDETDQKEEFIRTFPLMVIFLKLVVLNLTEKAIIESLEKKEENGEPERKLADFLLNKLAIAVTELVNSMSKVDPNGMKSSSMLTYLLAHYLLTLTYVFQSGLFPKLTKAAMEVLRHRPKATMDSFNEFTFNQCHAHFMALGKLDPTLTAHWLNLLYVLNHEELPRVLVQGIELSFSVTDLSAETEKELSSINLEIVRLCSLVLLCDHLSESLESVEYLSWLVINHLPLVVSLDRETPIREFLAACHRKASSSGLFLQSISSRHLDFLGTPTRALKVLRCLERAHFSQSAALVKFLLERFLFNEKLAGYYNCIKYAEYIACNRLVAMFVSSGIDGNRTFSGKSGSNRLSLKDINNLIKILKRTAYVRLSYTVHAIKAKHFNLRRASPPMESLRDPLTEVANSSPENFIPEINRSWFTNILREHLTVPLKNRQAAALVGGCFSKLSVSFDVEQLMFEMMFDLRNLRLVIDFLVEDSRSSLAAVTWNFSKVKGMPEAEKSKLACRLVQTCLFYMQKLCVQVEHVQEEQQTELAMAFLPVFETLMKKACQLKEKYYIELTGNELIARTAVDVYAVWMLPKVQREGDLVTVINLLAIIERLLDEEMLMVGSEETTEEEEMLFKLQSRLVDAFYGLFVQYFDLHQLELPSPLVKAIQDERIISSCSHMVSMLRTVELDLASAGSKRLDVKCKVPERLVYAHLQSIVFHLARLPFVRFLLYFPYDHFDVNSRVYSANFWQGLPFSGRWRTKLPIVTPLSLADIDIFKQFAFRIDKLGFTTRVEFEEIWMTLLGVLSNTLGSLEATPTSHERRDEVNELLELACSNIEAITSLLYSTRWDNRNLRRSERRRGNERHQSYLGNQKLMFGSKLEAKIREQLRNQLRRVDEELDNWREVTEEDQEDKRELEEVSLTVLRNNSRRSSRGSDSSATSSPMKTVSIGIEKGDESIDLYSCIHFLLDTYYQTIRNFPSTGTSATSFFPLFSKIATSCVIISDLFVERAQYQKMIDIWTDMAIEDIVNAFEDELLNSRVIESLGKVYSVMLNNSTKEVGTDFESYRRTIIEHSVKEFFVPTKIAALKALRYLVECCTPQLITWKEMTPVVDHLSKHFTLEGAVAINYSRTFQRQLYQLTVTLIENYRELTLGSSFIDQTVQVLVRQLTASASGRQVGTRNLRHVHELLERLLFSNKLSTRQIKTIKSAALMAMRSANGRGQVATLLRLNLFLTSSYLLRAGDTAVDLPKIDDQLYRTREQLANIFEPLRYCNSLEADLLSQTLGAFLVDFFPLEHLLNKCILEFLANQQQHCKYLANMLFTIFSRFHQADVHSGTVISQEWVVLSISSFKQLVPMIQALWALTVFFICAAQNHWIRASYPYFQSRFGQFDETDKLAFFTICYNFYHEIKSDENRKAFVKTFQEATTPPGTTGTANSSNNSTTSRAQVYHYYATEMVPSSPYLEVLKYLRDC